MKRKMIRIVAVCTILALLCAGAVFQYMTADYKSERAGAVLVMACYSP